MAETGIEYAAVQGFGSDADRADFSVLGAFGKNFGINLATGGIGGKGKAAYRLSRLAGMYTLRQGIEIGAETAYDVGYYGRDFGSSLAINTIGSIAGEGIARGIGVGFRRFNANYQIGLNPAYRNWATNPKLMSILGSPADLFKIQRRVSARTTPSNPADFVKDAAGHTRRAEGIIVGPHKGRKKGGLPEVKGGRAPGHHRGHLVPENLVVNPKLFNIADNLISEAPYSNLSQKKIFENIARDIALENPNEMVRFISFKMLKKGETVPFAVTHFVTVANKIVRAQSIYNLPKPKST